MKVAFETTYDKVTEECFHASTYLFSVFMRNDSRMKNPNSFRCHFAHVMHGDLHFLPALIASTDVMSRLPIN
jgi:hypothetical protein